MFRAPVDKQEEGVEGPVVFIEYYTDPLCSWSWAFEAQWRRLCYEYAGQLGWRYRMGGLLADWQSYADPFNDIHKPAQMGPQWFQVSDISGMPLDDRLWRIDPPDSSYPACLAVKAAERQGMEVAERYLRRLREAALLECRNIARQDVLFTLAQETAEQSSRHPFDPERFRADFAAPEVVEAFRQDLRDAAYSDIGRFPTLILHRRGASSIMLVGYRPYEALLAALKHLAPDLLPGPEMSREDLAIAYVSHWGRVIARELAEAIGSDAARATELLEALVARKMLVRVENDRCATPVYAPPINACPDPLAIPGVQRDQRVPGAVALAGYPAGRRSEPR